MNAADVTISRSDSAVVRRRALARSLSVRGGAALVVWFVGWTLSGPAPDPTPGTPTCREASAATTEDYLTGVVCPPSGFSDALGYEPALERTGAEPGGASRAPRAPTDDAADRSGVSVERWSSSRPVVSTTTVTTSCDSASASDQVRTSCSIGT
jgi:hypothetical protein